MAYRQEEVVQQLIQKLEAMNDIAIKLNVAIYQEGGGDFKAKNVIELDSLTNKPGNLSDATRYKLLYFSNRVLSNCQWINKSINDIYGESGGTYNQVGPPPEPVDPPK